MFILKKSLIAASIIALSVSIASISTANAAAHEKADAVVAIVNGDKILQSTLDGYLKILKDQKRGKANTQEALDDLIATEIALQEARKTDILDRAVTKKTISDYTRNVLLQTWTKEKIEAFEVDDAAIKEAYDERVANLADKEFNARHILLETEDEAKAVIKEATAEGADFAKIAKEKSTGPSNSNGGSLGWFKAQTMVPAFANAVKEMEKGDVSKEPVKTQFGYHVIKLEDSRNAKLPSLESLKPQLERVISQKKMLAYMENLKKDSDIKITLSDKPAMMEKKMDKADHKAMDKKMDKTMDKTMDKAMDKKMDKAMDKTMDKAMDKTMDKAMDKTMDKAMDKTMDKAMDKTMDKAMDKTMDKAMDKTMDKVMDKTMDKAMDKPKS